MAHQCVSSLSVVMLLTSTEMLSKFSKLVYLAHLQKLLVNFTDLSAITYTDVLILGLLEKRITLLIIEIIMSFE